MRNKHVLAAVLLTYLLISFVPSLSLANFLGKGKKKGATRTRAKLWTAERERAWREDYAARVAAGSAGASIAHQITSPAR